MKMRPWIAAGAIVAGTAMDVGARADMTGVVQIGYTVTATDFGGAEVTAYVVDLFMTSDDPSDTLLNIYNFELTFDTNKCPLDLCFFQSFTGTGWMPTNLGGPFDTEALRRADSFVTIGGFSADALQTPGAGAGTGLDPNFGGNNACHPGIDAGWYNSSPPSLNGGTMTYDSGITGVLIGRFASIEGEFSIYGTLEATWNQGLGTPGQQSAFWFGYSGGGFPDCNANGIPDDCDLADGTSTDYDADGLPDDCEGGTVGTDYATIADGLLDAPDGGVLVVPAGTWTAPFTIDRPVTLIAPDGPDATILSNSGAPRTIVTAHAAPAGAALIGFTITNGVGIGGQVGGGIDAIDSYLRLENCVIRGNFGSEGGGARFQGGAPVIRGCTFRDNISQGFGGGLRLVASDATVEDCVFESNEAAANSLGWAFAVSDGATAFRDIEVMTHDGDAIGLERTPGLVAATSDIVGLSSHDNTGRGLAIVGDDPAFCSLRDSRICGNTGVPIDGPHTDLGDNILFADGCPDLVVPDDADTIQLAIDAALDGERIAVRPGVYDEAGLDLSGRDLELVGVEDASLPRPAVTGPIVGSGMPASSLIRSLVVRDGRGLTGVPGHGSLRVGGGLVLDASSATVERCEIVDNAADLGGGVFIRTAGDVPVLRNVFVARNTAVFGGGGIHIEGDAAAMVTLDGCLITSNVVPTDGRARGGGIDARGLISAGSLSIANSSLLGNVRENLALDPAARSFSDLGGNEYWEPEDCDGDGVADIAAVIDFAAPDCNGNLVPDDCDLARGTSADCDGDGTPDDCQLGYDHTVRYKIHDGVADNGFGTGEPGTLAWLQRFVAAEGLNTIREVGVEFALPWSGPAYNGLPVTVGVWSDPDGDGAPYDAVPIALMEVTIEDAPAADRQFVTLPAPVSFSIGESFFVGAIMDRPQGPFYPAATDTSGASTESWFAFDPTFFEPDEIGDAAEIGTLPSIGLNWRWMITAIPEYDQRDGDCNANAIVDVCETADGTKPDCDGNGIPDLCDLANGAPDVDLDGVLDACQDQLVFAVPDRFGSINAAIAVAPDGSRIQLSAAGSPYFESLDFGTRNLELIGDPNDPESVVVDAFGLASTVITIAGGQDGRTLVSGILVKQGIAGTPEPGSPTNLVGGGFYIDGADPVIEDCIITNNEASRGGGAYLRFSEAVLRRVTIESNLATGGGAGIWWSDGIVSLEDCEVLDNTSDGNGGGLRAAAGSGVIVGGTFAGNFAANDGGGLWWQGSTQPLAIDGAVITGNIAGELGGGIRTRYGYPGVTFVDAILCDNFPDEIDGIFTDLGGNDLCLCPADLNGDGEVNGEDIGLFLAYAGNDCDPFTPCPGDVNLDGEISGADIGQILSAWGVCP